MRRVSLKYLINIFIKVLNLYKIVILVKSIGRFIFSILIKRLFLALVKELAKEDIGGLIIIKELYYKKD